jgi:hypothetical protein
MQDQKPLGLRFGVSLRASTLLVQTQLPVLCLLVARTLIIAPALGALAQTHNCSKHISMQQNNANSNWTRGRLLRTARGKNYFDSFIKVACIVSVMYISLRYKQLEALTATNSSTNAAALLHMCR